MGYLLKPPEIGDAFENWEVRVERALLFILFGV